MALDLTLQSTIDYILGQAQEAVKYDDKKAAQEIIKIFKRELPAQQQKVSEVPGLYEKYKNAWISAQFIFLPSIADEDFFDLIKEHLVEGLRLEEYDFVDKVGKRISFMDLEAEQIDFMEKLLDVLKKNTSTLGSGVIKTGGRTILPTIGNWLVDYDSYPSKKAQKTDYEEIDYVSKSPNTVSLSEADKQVLLDILECYDSLRNILTYYRSLPDATEEYINNPANYAQFIRGATLVDNIDESNNAISPEPLATEIDTVVTPANTEPVFKNKQEFVEGVINKDNNAVEPNKNEAYMIEDRPNLPKPVKPVIENKPIPQASGSSVALEIKRNLGIIDSYAPARLNIQDMLNERHNKGENKGGIVFGGQDTSLPENKETESDTAKSALPVESADLGPQPKSVIAQPKPAVQPKPNFPDITELELPAPIPEKALPEVNSNEEIAKKLAALKQRKQN